MAKQQVGKMTSWQIGELTKGKIDKQASWQNSKLA